MSIQEVTFYKVTCDEDGCGRNTADLGEFAAWAEFGQAVDNWNDSDGWVSPGGRTLCSDHRPPLCIWCDAVGTAKDENDEDVCAEHSAAAGSSSERPS